MSDELIVNKSKFIGYCLVGKSRDDFIDAIRFISKNMVSANHVAFAYRLITKQGVDGYFNDAGEPSGTAGKPLLNILEKQSIVNSGLAVVRFYGGINLGTGGSARAYTRSGMAALNMAKVTDFIHYFEYKLSIRYNMLDKITNEISKNQGSILKKTFNEDITIIIRVTEEVFLNILKLFPTIHTERLN